MMNFKNITALLLVVSMSAVASAKSAKQRKNWNQSVVREVPAEPVAIQETSPVQIIEVTQEILAPTPMIELVQEITVPPVEVLSVETQNAAVSVDNGDALTQPSVDVVATQVDPVAEVTTEPVVSECGGYLPAPEMIDPILVDPVWVGGPGSCLPPMVPVELLTPAPTPFDCIIAKLREFIAGQYAWTVDDLWSDLSNISSDHQARRVAERVVAFIINQIEIRERVASNNATAAINEETAAQNIITEEMNAINAAIAQENAENDAELNALNREIEAYVDGIMTTIDTTLPLIAATDFPEIITLIDPVLPLPASTPEMLSALIEGKRQLSGSLGNLSEFLLSLVAGE